MDIIKPEIKTMSSREVAELLNIRHDSVKRTIMRLMEAKSISNTPMVDGIRSANGVVPTHYDICKRDSYVIVAQLSPTFTAKLVDRWQELEGQNIHPKLPENYIEALESLVVAEKEKAQLTQQLQIAAPKIDYHDRVLATTNGITTTEIASELGISAIKLNRALKVMRIQRKVGNRWVLTAPNLDKGLTVEVTHIDDSGESRHSMKWSEAGRKFIHELMEG